MAAETPSSSSILRNRSGTITQARSWSSENAALSNYQRGRALGCLVGTP
jgi:hypothetical protein